MNTEFSSWLVTLLMGSAFAATPASTAPQDPARSETEAAAAEAMATATDVIAEGNKTAQLPQATFEACMNGIQNFVSEAGQEKDNSITLRHHKVTWDGRRILDLKTGEILWSHTTDQLRLDGPDRRPEVAEAKKAMLVAEFEKPRRFVVDRTTDPVVVRALHASIEACRNVSLETFGMIPISKVATGRLRELNRSFPNLFRSATAPTNHRSNPAAH